MFAGSPMLPPVILAVSAPASRRTSTCRFDQELIDVSVVPAPRLYERLTSPRRKLREDSVVAELDRWPCRRERIAEDVEDVDAIPSAQVDFLIDQARRDTQTVHRLEEE
jgi:hypothetical protein